MSDQIDSTATEEDVPCCAECDTALTDYEDEDPQYSGFGFGCPDCLTPHCPFCYMSLMEECSHLIFDRGEEGVTRTPFDNEGELREAIEKFLAKFEEIMDEGGWSEAQKKRAFGTLLSVYEEFEAELDDADADKALGALVEALPSAVGTKQVPFLAEAKGMGYSSWSGFFINDPAEARRQYSAHAAKFIMGLNVLAAIEPEGG